MRGGVGGTVQRVPVRVLGTVRVATVVVVVRVVLSVERVFYGVQDRTRAAKVLVLMVARVVGGRR